MTDYTEFKAHCEATKGNDPRAAYALKLMGEFEHKAGRKKGPAPEPKPPADPFGEVVAKPKTSKRRKKIANID